MKPAPSKHPSTMNQRGSILNFFSKPKAADGTSSASTTTSPAVTEYWECVICKATIPADNDVVNMHLNLCMSRQNERKKVKGMPQRTELTKEDDSSTLIDSHISKKQVLDRVVAKPLSVGVAESKDTNNSPDDDDAQFWSCFICNKRIRNDNDVINLHIGACLERQQLKEYQQSQQARQQLQLQDDEYDAEVERDNVDYTIKFAPSSFTFTAFGIAECIFSPVPGLILIPEFITESEELALIQDIQNDQAVAWESTNWTGHMQSKRFGMVTVFGIPRSNDYVNTETALRGTGHKRSSEIRGIRAPDESKGEFDLPPFTDFAVQRLNFVKKDILEVLYERIRLIATRGSRFNHSTESSERQSINTKSLVQLADSLKVFVPNECNINFYDRSRGDFLRSHCDDRELSGPLLMNLSLCGKAKMRYSLEAAAGGKSHQQKAQVVDVPLPRRCLQLISGDGRYKWEHAIPKEALLDETRISITWRGAGIKSRTKSSLVL